MRVLVTIKQVPDTNNVTIDKRTGTLNREGVPSIINPEDRHAIEGALYLKETYGASVTVLTMGPPQAREALREALAMGVDEACLMSDRSFAGADTLATAYTLSRGVLHLGEFDIIFGGRQAIDGDTAQVGPQLAGFLDIPQITYVCGIEEINEQEKFLVVRRETDDEIQKIKAPFPALLTVIKEFNTPRYPSVGGIFDSFEKEIRLITAKELTMDTAMIGLEGSPTQVHRTFTPTPKGEGVKVEGTPKEIATRTLGMLKDKGFI
ncbi:MAG: electron transfer flavoprotein subunit beta [Candidatus Wallbacteria bacterium HGW-Wallbacteria-1]|jgi:electron transfer flavoprotein beta subunit|uniref:Electron transfer flavoprotein subunit beta n=1 Tax=Candidatus Wallbacteria bacterium HGW-Wallbacteria-1 TaxID=2013854 RepID=A0A2N1PQB8_9BACT|nr:MAG: electron transfer flavoprotein subunit beta [Candidatus Wallbacteria bacterium HGW-Wallbacteria-1]